MRIPIILLNGSELDNYARAVRQRHYSLYRRMRPAEDWDTERPYAVVGR